MNEQLNLFEQETIQIKAWFSGWHDVTYDKALNFAKYCFNTIMNISDMNERVEWINNNHIRGIRFTLKELQDDID